MAPHRWGETVHSWRKTLELEQPVRGKYQRLTVLHSIGEQIDPNIRRYRFSVAQNDLPPESVAGLYRNDANIDILTITSALALDNLGGQSKGRECFHLGVEIPDPVRRDVREREPPVLVGSNAYLRQIVFS